MRHTHFLYDLKINFYRFCLRFNFPANTSIIRIERFSISLSDAGEHQRSSGERSLYVLFSFTFTASVQRRKAAKSSNFRFSLYSFHYDIKAAGVSVTAVALTEGLSL